jgi:hypothetical protein
MAGCRCDRDTIVVVVGCDAVHGDCLVRAIELGQQDEHDDGSGKSSNTTDGVATAWYNLGVVLLEATQNDVKHKAALIACGEKGGNEHALEIGRVAASLEQGGATSRRCTATDCFLAALTLQNVALLEKTMTASARRASIFAVAPMSSNNSVGPDQAKREAAAQVWINLGAALCWEKHAATLLRVVEAAAGVSRHPHACAKKDVD